jgi:D-alanyl-D-alanine carboxypeptidase
MKSKSPLSAKNIKLFVGTFSVMFLMVGLSQLGIHAPSILSPLPTKVDIFDAVEPLLEQKENTFHLSKPLHLINPVSASGNYENASSYLLMDFTSGEILESKHADTSIPIASLTKIMTAVVALDLVTPSERFTVTQRAADQVPTKIGVVAGEKLTLDELLHAMLMTSANDAAEVVRDGVDAKFGGDVFIRAMNEKAKLIGLTHTHFQNPQGFDSPEHYSSASDLAVLSHYALTNYPVLTEIVKKEYTFLPATSDHKQYDLYNWNGLLGVYPGASGIKIGNTDAAGMTTVVTATREGKKLLAVLLGAPGILQRDLWTAELLDSGFAQTINGEPVDVTEKMLRDKYATWKYYH